VRKRQFGVSTHLYRAQRLQREHLLEIAAHGFEAVELVAAAGHFDPRHQAAIADLQQWLAEARLDLTSVAVPAGSTIEDAEHALFIARRIPLAALVVAVGPVREAAKMVERLAELAEPLGVTVAVDSRSDSMTPIGSLVHFVEAAEHRLGIALDFASSARGGGLVDAIEAASEHLAAVRVPLEGAIDWSAAMTTAQKVGYEGPLIFDLPPAAPPKATLARARKAREGIERWLTST